MTLETHDKRSLSALEIGPKSVLEPKYARQVALNVAVPQAISATLLLMGASVSLAADEGAKAKLRALTEEAIGRGVFGVPTFAAPTENGHELFWGVDAFDMLKAWLADGTMFSREPYAHLDGIEVGIRRK